MLIGAVETGGTKIVAAVGDERLNIIRRETFPTLTPGESMPRVIDFFRGEKLAALGLGSFGPVDLNADSPSYGSVTDTPKIAWRHFPVLKTLREALNIPCAVDTDVNVAALAEATVGAAKGLKNCVYVTIGTGIGCGVYVEGTLLHGKMHPEWGHIPLAPHRDDPSPEGCCPYHKGCLEGLAAGPALEKRWGVPGRELPEGHIGWDMEAYYLAQLCATAFLTVSPEKILLGGGVMARAGLMESIRQKTLDLLNGYLAFVRPDTIEELIVPPALYPDSGLIGSLILGRSLL